MIAQIDTMPAAELGAEFGGDLGENFLQLFAPELVLVASSAVLLLWAGFARTDRSVAFRYVIATLLVIYAVMGFVVGAPEGQIFSGALQIDLYGHYAKLVLGLAAASALVFGLPYFQRERLDSPEFSILVLESVLGMSVMISANNLLSVYIGVELQSLALYIMAATNRDSLRSSEAGLKYVVLGSLSSGILLYGMSLIYGFAGSLDFDVLALVLADGETGVGVTAGLVFLLAGLAFKISAAPFHMWTPDVYEGSPTPVTAFFATAPKFAAMVLIGRILLDPLAAQVEDWRQVLAIIAVLSMFVGVLGALAQTNIKRLMAYSSIANMGYALVALSAATPAGVAGMLIFMSIYVITNIGVFSVILQMRTGTGMVERIDDLSGLSQTDKGMAVALSIFMFSLLGMPLFAGFLGKVFAFVPAIEAGLWWLVVLALLASVIGSFYYLRVVKTIWFDEARAEFVAPAAQVRLYMIFAAILVAPALYLPFIAQPARAFVERAALSLF